MLDVFLSYVTNVFFSWLPYFWVGAGASLILFAVDKITNGKVSEVGLTTRFYQTVAWVLLFALLYCATITSNTPKREHHDKVELNQKIETQNLNRETPQVVDRTRKPEKTAEERAARFKEITRY